MRKFLFGFIAALTLKVFVARNRPMIIKKLEDLKAKLELKRDILIHDNPELEVILMKIAEHDNPELEES